MCVCVCVCVCVLNVRIHINALTPSVECVSQKRRRPGETRSRKNFDEKAAKLQDEMSAHYVPLRQNAEGKGRGFLQRIRLSGECFFFSFFGKDEQGRWSGQ